MTKEQEAIEKCKEIIQQNKEIVKQARLSKDTNAIELTANCNKESIAIETVLNMLKEKDAEIEQKNEVLNRVYDFIWENDCCRYFSKKHALCNQVLNFDSCLGNCKRNCIKQYFERKATNNS
ncbi:MAG: hypothetical protein ACLVGD_04455 [Monoglobales bacterium]